ncbi:4-hydroxy-tetrahydrodipicolinate reductase [Sessilibacter sp. MAH2]
MTTNIAITGATGRMGKMLVQAVHSDKTVNLSAAIVRPGSSDMGKDAGEIAGLGRLGVPLLSELISVMGRANALIDFSTPSATIANAEVCADLGKAMVIGTTGFSDADREVLKELSTRAPICLSANYSTGLNITLKLLEMASKSMGEDIDIEIVEAHHRHKVDAPSGTALAMGQVVAKARNLEFSEFAVFAREGITGARRKDTIGFSTIRGGDIIGDHTVMFLADGERVEITHKASSRMAFAHGAVRAAVWLAKQPPGLYNMQDVLGIRNSN